MTTTEIPELFDRVVDAINDAHLVAYDGCHKIYLAMDEVEAEWFRNFYEFVVAGSAEVMLDAVIRWYENSCGLRFVTAVRHDAENPNAGYTQLISQFEDLEEEGEEE